MRILCVFPSLLSGWNSYVMRGNNESSYMDHGFAMISAVLKTAGHDPFLVDLRALKNWEHFEDVISKADYELSLISFFTCNEKHAREAVARMKKIRPDKLIVGGGIHLSVTRTEHYPNIDSIVWGEGENHILKIVKDVEEKKPLKPIYDMWPVENLDTLPFVDRSFFNAEMEQSSPLLDGLPAPFVTIVAGRGCFGLCRFCFPSRSLISGRRIKIRSVWHFLDEVCLIDKAVGGIGSLMIHDDLLGTSRWMTEFIAEWKKRIGRRIPFWCQLRADSILQIKDFIPQLAEIGLSYVSVGLESGSPRMLEFLQKGTTVEQNIEACKILHDNDINIFANFIIGLPTETPEDLDGTERMLSIIRPHFLARSVWTHYPGNGLHDWIEANDCAVKGDGPEAHYGMGGRYPYERKMKGVNYDYIFKRASEWDAKYKGPLRQWTKKNG